MGQLERVVAAAQAGPLNRFLAALGLALASGAGLAQGGSGGGLIESGACQRALQVLEARESATAPDRSAAKAALEAARRQAATACLGGRASAASAPPRAAQPATTLGAPPAAIRIAPPPLRPVLPPAPPRPAAAPLSISACDPAGCWASDGSRLQRVGPNLLGPTGFCTTSGNLLHCPR